MPIDNWLRQEGLYPVDDRRGRSRRQHVRIIGNKDIQQAAIAGKRSANGIAGLYAIGAPFRI
jgi:hypothetical protein